jgi:hypothetical protein
LYKIIRDLEMIDIAFEPEELREASTGKDSKNERTLPHELGVAQAKGPMHED